MKLTENTADFAVVWNAFHGGGVYSFHRSLSEAIKARKKVWRQYEGSIDRPVEIIPVSEYGVRELTRYYEDAARSSFTPVCIIAPVVHTFNYDLCIKRYAELKTMDQYTDPYDYCL